MIVRLAPPGRLDLQHDHEDKLSQGNHRLYLPAWSEGSAAWTLSCGTWLGTGRTGRLELGLVPPSPLATCSSLASTFALLKKEIVISVLATRR